MATTDALGQTSTTVYDAVGNVLKVTDRNGHVTTDAYDAINRPIQKQVAGGPTVNYTYDNLDQVTGVSNGSLAIRYGYLPDLTGYITSVQQTSPTLPLSATVNSEEATTTIL